MTQSLRISIIVRDFAPGRTGLQPWSFFGSLARALKEEGHHLTIWTDSGGDEVWNGVPVLVAKTPRPLYGSQTLHRIAVEMHQDALVVPFSWRFARTLVGNRPLPRDLPAVGVSLGPSYELFQLARRFASPALIRETPKDLSHVANWLVRHLGVWAESMPALRKLMFLWEGDARLARLAGVSEGLCSVVSHPFDPFFLSDVSAKVTGGLLASIPESDQRIVFAGPAESSRGLEDVMRVARILRLGSSAQVLALIRDPAQSNLRVSMGRVGENDLVQVRGVLPRDDLREIFSRASVVCLPYHFVRSGFPKTILDAVAAGATVVTTPVYPLIELRGRTGIGFAETHRPRDIAERIRTLIESRSETLRLKRLNQDWLESCPTWSDLAQMVSGAITTGE